MNDPLPVTVDAPVVFSSAPAEPVIAPLLTSEAEPPACAIPKNVVPPETVTPELTVTVESPLPV